MSLELVIISKAGVMMMDYCASQVFLSYEKETLLGFFAGPQFCTVALLECELSGVQFADGLNLSTFSHVFQPFTGC